jgi:hypothetical protein
MTPGQLVKAVSIALDVPEETVVQHDRNLAVAGLRTKKGRGPSAAAVTHLDAARLFVATLASIRTRDSVDAVKRFEGATNRKIQEEEPEFPVDGQKKQERFDFSIAKLPRFHNFIEGLTSVIADASRPISDFQAFLKQFNFIVVSCDSPGTRAAIQLPGAILGYQIWREHRNERTGTRHMLPTFMTRQEQHEQTYCTSEIWQKRYARGPAIMLLGSAFRDNGLRYASVREAYLDEYGTKGDIIIARKAARKKSNRKVS